MPALILAAAASDVERDDKDGSSPLSAAGGAEVELVVADMVMWGDSRLEHHSV